MDFQKQNETYNNYKKLLAEEREKVEGLKAKILELSAKVTNLNAEKAKAKGKKQETVEKELESLMKELAAASKDLMETENNVRGFAEKIDETIREVSKDPEIMREVNESLAKDYSKKIKGFQDKEKEKGDKIKKKQETALGLYELFKVLNKDPETSEKVIEYVKQKIKTKELNKEREKLIKKEPKGPDDFKRIGEIDVELGNLKESMKKNKEDISKVIEAQTDLKYLPKNLEDVIEALAAKGLVKGKNKQIDISETIKATIEQTSKDIEKLEGEQRDSADRRKAYEEAQKGVSPIVTTDRTNPGEQQPKVKWYQRISNWFQNRKAKTEEHEQPEQSTPVDKKIKQTELYKAAKELIKTEQRDGISDFYESIKVVRTKEDATEAARQAYLAAQAKLREAEEEHEKRGEKLGRR